MNEKTEKLKRYCSACSHTITTPRYIKCKQCNKTFHHICVNTTAGDPINHDSWLCPECRNYSTANRQQTGTELNVNSGACASPYSGNVTTNSIRASKRAAPSSPITVEFNNIDCEKNILAELRIFRQEMHDYKACLSDGLTKCLEKIDSFDRRIKNIEEQVLIIPTLQTKIAMLEEQLAQQSQTAMKNEIEILGLQENQNENLSHIVLTIAAKIGVNLQDTDIDWTARVGPQKSKSHVNSKQQITDTTPPRPVIVKLVHKSRRDELIKNSRTRRTLSSIDIDVPGPNRRIFINEHITKQNRILFRDARTRFKENGIRFCWVNNGRILARKSERCPAITINSAADLDHIIKKYSTHQTPTIP